MAAATSSTSRKRSQYVWAPHPLEGYVLGHVTDVGGDSLTVELVGTGHAEKQVKIYCFVADPPLSLFAFSLTLSLSLSEYRCSV